MLYHSSYVRIFLLLGERNRGRSVSRDFFFETLHSFILECERGRGIIFKKSFSALGVLARGDLSAAQPYNAILVLSFN